VEHIDDLRRLVLFDLGRTPVTLGGVVAGLAVMLVMFALAKVAGLALRRLRTRSRQGREALYIVERLTTYGLVMFGVFAGLSTVGLNMSSLAVFAGAVGVGVGLGLQGVVKEFVSGLVLIFDRVLNVGDYVELEDGKRGQILEIGPRAVRIRTGDDIDLIVPNSKFTEGPVINWTLHDRTSRVHIPFTVATGTDRRKVRELVLKAAREVPFTSPETEAHKTQVWMTGFGGSGLEFELAVWPTLEAVKRPGAMRAAYLWAIADALDAAGIETPTSLVDVRILGEEGEAPIGEPGRLAPANHENDAAQELAKPVPPPEPDPEERPFRDATERGLTAGRSARP
jgi:small-conductance mechanosensitive channel